MSVRRLRVAVVLGLLFVLAACAPVRVRETPAALAGLQAREAQLAPRTHWSLSARIFVSDGGENSGSGDLEWRHDGDRFEFTLRAPTGRTWKLSGDAGAATLEGVDPQPIRGNDPQRLLRERLGWDVPVAELADWVRAVRAPGGDAEVQYDELGRPAILTQHGWTIEYRDWFAENVPPMPRKVYAARGKARVKLAIDHWSFNE
jgi:outer membrane lipoprotein LolB